MAYEITTGDYLGVYTAGWFNSDTAAPTPFDIWTGGWFQGTTYPSYLTYSKLPNDWIVKCGGQNYNNERYLFDSVVTEAYNKHGVCMTYYIASYNTDYDKVFGEDRNRRFTRKFSIMSFFNLPREEKLWTKFGIEGMDNFSMFVSKMHFKEASKYDADQVDTEYPSYIPKQGDVIASEYNKYIYEIVEVKEEIGMYLLSKQHVWELIVKPFKDELIALDPATSATMTYIKDYTNKDSDVFDLSNTVDNKKPDVLYDPKPSECNPDDPFAGW